MGRFSTTVQIKDNVGRIRFKEIFCSMMEKRGFETCTEDEAAQSYLLAFGEGWVTLASKDYRDNPHKAFDDAQQAAEIMKTSAFSVAVVDSDFATLTLNNGDTVIIGNCLRHGIDKPAHGTREYWEPLIEDGSWEQFREIVEREDVLAEDTLAKLSEVLAISPKYICADYEELADGNSENVVRLYFKKAPEKRLTLNTAFKQVFGEALRPLGYKLINGKYPYFVRVVSGGEIIHAVTCVFSSDSWHNARRFDIVGGIATVYRYRIELDRNSKYNSTWLNTIGEFYARTAARSEYSQTEFESLNSFRYDEDDNLSLYNAMKRSLEAAKKYMLPYLDRAIDLKSSLNCITTLKQECSTNNFAYPFNFQFCSSHDEGFLYIKTNDEAMVNALKRKLDGTAHCDEQTRRRAAEKYTFMTDPEVLEEIERRKTQNTGILRSYGLSL